MKGGFHMSDASADYLAGLSRRLQADRCTVTQEQWQTPVTLGYRNDFRLRWMAVKLHLFVPATIVPVVDRATIEGFTGVAWEQMVARKGSLRGLQTGVGVLPVVIGSRVEPDAAAWAEEKQRVKWATFARPVVVDATTGRSWCFRGRAAVGALFNGHLRRKLALYVPEQRGE